MSADSSKATVAAADVSQAQTHANPVSAKHSFWSDVLQLFVLSTFVISQPLLDRLGRQATFLIQEQIEAAGLLLAVVAVVFAVPGILLVVEALVRRCCGARMQHRLHRLFVFALSLIFALYVQLVLIEAANLHSLGLPGLLLVLIGTVVALGLTWLTENAPWFRIGLTYASLGIVVFPAAFFLNPNVRGVLFPPSTPSDRTSHADNPVPIVMVVFDGFTGMALLDENHDIDAIRYPNFARLSQTSHWFRNATTMHPRTLNAVPSILSGCVPKDVVAIRSEYPQNLLQLIHDSGQYEMTVFEPYTRLCPPSVGRATNKTTVWEQATTILHSLSTLYLHLTVPPDLSLDLPEIPRAWFGLPESSEPSWEATTGLVVHGWDQRRDDQFLQFLKSLQPTEPPGFRFLHVVLPHYPWDYFSDGRRYIPHVAASQPPIGTHGYFGEIWTIDPLVVEAAWQRYLLQLGYVDLLLGKLIDQLQSEGLFDDCLLIVTADHGTGFLPGQSRRDPVNQNLPDLLSVPLFIKLPGQTEGVTSDRNVESIDIFPTICDVIDMEVAEPVDGASLFDESIRPRLRKTFFAAWEPLILSADYPERFQYVDRMIRLFGTGAHNDRLRSHLYMPELVGRPLTEFTIDEVAELEIQLVFGSGHYNLERPEIVPGLFSGHVTSFSSDTPATLVIALNNEIVAVTRTIRDPQFEGSFTVLAIDAEYRPGDNDLQIFELLTTESGTTLRRCRIR